MAWTTEIIESIHQIDPKEWDCLVKDRPFANWRWLQLTEAVLLDHQPRYVLLRQNGELRAGIVTVLQTQFQTPRFQATLGGVIQRFPGLRCGIPLSGDPGLFVSDQDSLVDLLPVLMQGLETLIQREHISFHTIDHIWSTMPLWEYLQARGYHRIEHLAEIYLDIQWSSFTDYLSDLSKRKRKEFRRVNRRLEERDITLAVADPRTEDSQTLQTLVNNVFQRHHEPNLYVDELFLKASSIMGEDFKLIVARQGERLICCAAMLRSGNEWLGKWVGLDYAYTLNTGTYYRLVAECVRQAIQSGGRRIRLGATAYQTKRHFGAIRENRIGALAFRNGPIHYLAGKALQLTAVLGASGPIAEAPKREKKREAE